jgi:hypothetical protein
MTSPRARHGLLRQLIGALPRHSLAHVELEDSVGGSQRRRRPVRVRGRSPRLLEATPAAPDGPMPS